MVKVHYIGYPSSMDEWRNCSREEGKIMKLKQRFIPSEDTLEERLAVFRDKLFREIKFNLFSNKQQDPTISIEIEIELDEFEHFTKFWK